MSLQTFLGASAVIIALISYVPYFRDIFRGTTKPHLFTWFLFGLLSGIAFLAQVLNDGGDGAWVTGITAMACFAIAFLALSRGEKNITIIDWVCFIAALGAIVLWQLTDNALTAVVIVSVADTLAFVPTFRKAYWKPQEETAITFVLNGLKWLPALFALRSFTLTTTLFPIVLIVQSFGFVGMLLIRRYQLHV